MTKGYIKIDRSLLAYLDRSQPLSKFEAIIDILQSVVGSDYYDVTTHGKRVRLAKGHVILSISDCQRRWNWTPMAVRLFIQRLIADGVLTSKGTINNVGTVYLVANTLNNTHNNILNALNTNGFSVTNNTPNSTPNNTPHLSYKEVIIKKKEKERNFSVSPDQWKRFKRWAAQNIPAISGQITPQRYAEMKDTAEGDTNDMGQALIYICYTTKDLSTYDTIVKTKPWKTDAPKSNASSQGA